MTIGEFFITLGFKAETLKVRDFVKAIGDIPIEAAAAITALAGIDYHLIEIAREAMGAAAAFQTFTDETGLSWQELQRWQIAAQMANVSAESVASSVTSLQRQMAELRLGNGNIAPFKMLGINYNQDAFGVLRQLRERIKGLDPAMATNLISQMGIDPSMINLLRLTNTEFDRLSKTVRGMSGEQEGSFLRAKQTLVQFGLVVKYLTYDLIANLINGLNAAYDKLAKFKGILAEVGIGLAALAAYFFPVTAAVIGLMLVLEDLSVYFQGGNSIIGVALEGIKKFGDAIKNAIPSSLGQLAGLLGKLTIPVTLAAQALLPTNIAGQAPAVAGIGTGGRTVNQNVTMHIHSTAPAHDVGKAAAEHLKRAASDAALQTNQGGY